MPGRERSTAGRPAAVVGDAPAAHRYLPYEPGLDGIRGLAIAGVVLYHTRRDEMPGGFLGVSVFFTLSGFLITSLLLAERRARGDVDLGTFWGRRIKRLAPAAVVVLAAVVLVSRTSLSGWGGRGGLLPSTIVAAVANVANWHTLAAGPADEFRRVLGPLGPYWSLAVEEQFYAAIAVVFLALRWVRRPVLVLTVVLATTWIGSLAYGVLRSGWTPREEFGTDSRAAELAAGALLAVVVSRWPGLVSDRRNLLNAVGWVGLAVIVGVFALAELSQPWVLTGGYAGLSLVSVGLLLGVLAHGSLTTALSTRGLVALGKVSYPLYLVHWPVVLMVNHRYPDLAALPRFALTLLGALAAAVAVHVAVEQPLRRRPASTAAVLTGWVSASLAVAGLALALLG